jgi:hypothetical protein
MSSDGNVYIHLLSGASCKDRLLPAVTVLTNAVLESHGKLFGVAVGDSNTPTSKPPANLVTTSASEILTSR